MIANRSSFTKMILIEDYVKNCLDVLCNNCYFSADIVIVCKLGYGLKKWVTRIFSVVNIFNSSVTLDLQCKMNC